MPEMKEMSEKEIVGSAGAGIDVEHIDVSDRVESEGGPNMADDINQPQESECPEFIARRIAGMKKTSLKNLNEKTSIKQSRDDGEEYLCACYPDYSGITDMTVDPFYLSPSMFKMGVGLLDNDDEVMIIFDGLKGYMWSMDMASRKSKCGVSIDAFAEKLGDAFDNVRSSEWLVDVNDLKRIANAIPADMYHWEYLDKDVYNGENLEVRSHILWLMVYPLTDGLRFVLDVNRDTSNFLAGITVGRRMTRSETEAWITLNSARSGDLPEEEAVYESEQTAKMVARS